MFSWRHTRVEFIPKRAASLTSRLERNRSRRGGKRPQKCPASPCLQRVGQGVGARIFRNRPHELNEKSTNPLSKLNMGFWVQSYDPAKLSVGRSVWGPTRVCTGSCQVLFLALLSCSARRNGCSSTMRA